MKAPVHIGLRDLAERILNYSYAKSLEGSSPGTILYIPGETHELHVQSIYSALVETVRQAELEGKTEIVIEGFPAKIYVGKPMEEGPAA